MLGLWDSAYAGVTEPRSYGPDTTYRIGMDWLAGCASVEDWGCGTGYARQFCHGAYTGIDGSHSDFASVIADLRERRSHTDGIFMRHVLEHNEDWRSILGNAVASFTQRMALIIHTPLAEVTTVIAPGPIVDISFATADLLAGMAGCEVTAEHLKTATHYGQEHLFLAAKTALTASPPGPASARASRM